MTRWRAVGSVDLLLEVVLVVLPIFIFARVQMGTQKKVIVMIAFAFRIL